MKSGAQPGNKNASKRLPWQRALTRALTRLSDKEGDESPKYRLGLDRLADKVVAQAAEGNKDAWSEVANRLEGKPGQVITVAGDPDNPVALRAFSFDDEDKE